MNVWEHYDMDGNNFSLCCHGCKFIIRNNSGFEGNGFIEGEELNAFLREFIASVNSEENLQVLNSPFPLHSFHSQ